MASASPRRLALLSPYFSIQVIKPAIDERRKGMESPAAYVKRLSREKWQNVRKRIGGKGLSKSLLLASDTTVAMGDKIFGKPKNLKSARRMLLTLSGKEHEVLTAFSLGRAFKSKPSTVKVVRTRIRFKKISASELVEYLRSNDWQDKAGSYGIQGKAFQFVESIEGSLTSVVGLPLAEVLASALRLK